MKKLKKHGSIKLFEGFAGYGGATYGLMKAGINHELKLRTRKTSRMP